MVEDGAAEERRIYPRSSAFEALLSKVYVEIWNLQDDPAAYVSRIHEFVNVHLPTMFQVKLKKKIPKFNEKLKRLEARTAAIRTRATAADPFEQDAVVNYVIPAEEKEFAGMIWHATIDVLTEAGFNFPIAKAKPRRYMRA